MQRYFDFCMIVVDMKANDPKIEQVDLLRERVEQGWEILNATGAANKIVYIMRKTYEAKTDQEIVEPGQASVD